MDFTPNLKKKYTDEIMPNLKKEFGYKSIMQIPKLEKIIINQGVGQAVADKRLLDVAVKEISEIAGQKAVTTLSKKDISNFKLRKKMPIGVKVTLRKNRMYEFLERLIAVSIPRVRDFRGISDKFDGKGNYTLGIQEQIIFPEIDIDTVVSVVGMNVTFVIENGGGTDDNRELLRKFGMPFRD